MSKDALPPRLGLGIAIALVAYMFFVTASSLVWTLRSRIPVIEVLFFQNAISLLCIAPLALRKGLQGIKTHVFSVHLIRDLFGVGSYYLYFLAIRYLDLADATTLNCTAPFFVPLVWWIWLKEPVSKHIWWSIFIGFLGVATILNPSREIFQLGFLFGIFAGITAAVALSAIRMLNLKREPMSRTLFYLFFISLALVAPFAWVQWVPPTGSDLLQLLCLGLATVGGQMLLTIAYRHGTAAYLSPLGYATVIYAALISFYLFGKPFGLRSFLGALLIVGGGVLSYVFREKPKSLAETFEAPHVKAETRKPPL